MNIEELRAYCLSFEQVEEGFPFGEEVLVFKIKGKIFLLTVLNSEELSFNVKCDPEEAIELREQYNAIVPGWHMNKKHWNTVFLDGTVPLYLIKEMIKKSYFLVRGKK